MNPSVIESGICTPITNYLNQKNPDRNLINDFVIPKLNNLKRDKEYSNEGVAYKNSNNPNSSNNMNTSGISNFSLKDNSSIFQSMSIIRKN